MSLLVILLGYLSLGYTTGTRPKDNTTGGSSSQVLDISREEEYRFDYIKYPKKIDNITEFN